MKYTGSGWFISNDSCWNSMHADGCGEGINRYFIEGCGGINSGYGYYYDNSWGSCWNTLYYFKKSTDVWGTPIVFPGIDEREFGKVKITLSPNPFSEKAVLEIQGMNGKQRITYLSAVQSHPFDRYP